MIKYNFVTDESEEEETGTKDLFLLVGTTKEIAEAYRQTKNDGVYEESDENDPVIFEDLVFLTKTYGLRFFEDLGHLFFSVETENILAAYLRCGVLDMNSKKEVKNGD